MLKENQIFIHVPKTGGTTLNCALHGTDVPQNNSFNFRHLVYETKLSTSGDIFNPLKNGKYRDYKIFMMLRHPVDRILSEYYFIKERDDFFSLLKPSPKSFEEYALHRQTSNYVVSFLLGNRIYAKNRPTQEDLNRVMNGIVDLDITIGIYESFSESLALFQKNIGIQWPRTIENKRVTILRPKKEEVSKTLFDKIMSKHNLDAELYAHALDRFNKEDSLGHVAVKIKENRYQYVLTYTNKYILLELVLKGHPFLFVNKDYFKALSLFLADLKLQSGDEYLLLWKGALMNALKENNLELKLMDLLVQCESKHPIEFLKAFGLYISKSDSKTIRKLVLDFKRSHVKQQSLWSKFFDKF
jgi:hypothetical protein